MPKEASALRFKQELTTFGAAFIAATMILWIAFYKESPLTVIKVAAGIIWLFTLPGMAILWRWKDKLNSAALAILGTILGMAVVGIGSYYLGLVGINIKYSGIFLPIAVIAISAAISYWKKASSPL
jgi:hypothetical protein